MSEQRLHDALEAAVPDPPNPTGRGPAARARAGRDRRLRWAGAGAVVAALAVAVPVLRVVDARHDTANLPASVLGQGLATCRRLDHQSLGSAVDARTVDGATAGAWVTKTAADATDGSSVDPSQVSAARVVTVCVMASRPGSRFSVVVVAPGRSPVVYDRGDNRSIGLVMQPLDDLWKGGAPTTTAPFRCPGGSTPPATDVSTTLPEGATAARICFGRDGHYQPRQVLTTGLDDLVRSINDSSLVYTAPGMICTGTMMDYDYTLVFDYPSGTRSVTEQTCRGLAIGPYTRIGPAGDLDQTYLSMLARQESAAAPTQAPPCPAPSSDEPQGRGDLRHVVAARYCASGSTGPGLVLTGRQLSVLHHWGEWLLPGSPHAEARSCHRPTSGWPHLALADAWGNTFTMTLECQHRLYAVVQNVGGRTRLTHPTSLRDQVLRHLLRRLAAP